MPYLPTDHLLWDFWFAPPQEGKPVHVFYLRAPSSIEDPEDRHYQAEVGHASSVDLLAWVDQGVAFRPSEGPSWDDKAIWTGSITRHDDVWHFFYTALTHADHEQRIGLATSTDLVHWERHPKNPLVVADPSWCESAANSPDGHVAFRDPWVMRDPDGDGWLMYITTRVNVGLDDGRGVIALATSDDLVEWELHGPVTEAGSFAELEVPQYVELESHRFLLFCSAKPSQQRLNEPDVAPWAGTHYLTAPSAKGPWHLAPDPPMAADTERSWYAGRLLQHNDTWQFFAWSNVRDGAFGGGLSAPMPVEIGTDGTLRVTMPDNNLVDSS